MIEKLSLDKIESLHPKIKDEVKILYEQAQALLPPGITIRITQGLRTIAYQNELYAQGRTKPGKIVTNATGGRSYHNYGLAFDFCLIKDGKAIWTIDNNWMAVVNIFIDAGYTWGGNFKKIKDYPHLEKTFGYNYKYLVAKHINKDFIPGTEYVNI